MNFPTEAMADLPEEGRAMFLQTLEQMQVRDRWVQEQLAQQAAPCCSAHSIAFQYKQRHTRHNQLNKHQDSRWCNVMGCCTTTWHVLLLNHAPGMPLVCSLKQYNRLVERCFKECVSDFKSKNLDKEEEKVRHQ
jgi:hypothetical protein